MTPSLHHRDKALSRIDAEITRQRQYILWKFWHHFIPHYLSLETIVHLNRILT